MTSRELQRIDNRIKPRAVISWEIRGERYRNGRKISGDLRLHLQDGGWIWYPENTPLDMAFADADDFGFSTADIRQRLDAWIKTGKGGIFNLIDPR